MFRKLKYSSLVLFLLFLVGCTKTDKKKIITIWLIGDSTVADYSTYSDYIEKRFPVTGWGQVFQRTISDDHSNKLTATLGIDSILVDDRAVGGRSTRTFFQEGRWREVYKELQPNDMVLIQFGHNDGSTQKTERYVNEQGYKEFLRLFIQQAREKKAIPILVTPVARNYPWQNDTLRNVHGKYPQSMKDVALETQTQLIDLNERSMEFFTEKGKDYVKTHYFMNLPAGKFAAYPEGQNDNTHFQPEGATEVAQIVHNELLNLYLKTN